MVVPEENMNRKFGAMPGGGILSVYHFTVEEFGSIGARMILELVGETKQLRSKAFKAVVSMLRAYKLILSDEQVQSLAIGTGPKGHEVLVCATLIPHTPEGNE
jgi:hypothetical protein